MLSRLWPLAALVVIGLGILVASLFMNRASPASKGTAATEAPSSSANSSDQAPAAEIPEAGVAVGGDRLTRFRAGQLQRLNATTGKNETITLPTLPGAPVSANWSSDGKSALLQMPVSEPETPPSIWERTDLPIEAFVSWWLVDATTATPLPVGITNPTWTTDGKRIIYSYQDPTGVNTIPQLTIADPTGKNWQTLIGLTGLSTPSNLTSSPDGLWVAFTVTEGVNETTYVVGLGSKQLVKLAAGGGELKWAPDSSAVLLDQANGDGVTIAYVANSSVTNITVANHTTQLTWETPGSIVGFDGSKLVRLDLTKQTQTTIRTIEGIDDTVVVLGVQDNQLRYLVNDTIATAPLQ